jgi:hypothetical protein
MNVRDIIARGPQVIKNNDETHSRTGKSDFTPEAPPEILTFAHKGRAPAPVGGSKAPEFKRLEPLPRTKASENNSYT